MNELTIVSHRDSMKPLLEQYSCTRNKLQQINCNQSKAKQKLWTGTTARNLIL